MQRKKVGNLGRGKNGVLEWKDGGGLEVFFRKKRKRYCKGAGIGDLIFPLANRGMPESLDTRKESFFEKVLAIRNWIHDVFSFVSRRGVGEEI